VGRKVASVPRRPSLPSRSQTVENAVAAANGGGVNLDDFTRADGRSSQLPPWELVDF